MEKLDDGTVEDIFDFLDRNDACNFRLTAQRYERLGLRYVFRKIRATRTARNLQSLYQLSEHPSLSKKVRSIVYAAFSLNPRLTRIINFRQFKRHDERYNSPKCSEEEAREIYEKYHTFMDTCAAVEAYPDQAEFDLLSRALSHFPQLREMTLACDQVPEKWKNMAGDDYANPRLLPLHPHDPAALSVTTRSARKHLDTLLSVLASKSIKLKTFRVYHLDWQFFAGGDSGSAQALVRVPRNDAELAILFEPLASVEHLHLEIQYGYSKISDDDYECWAVMRTGVLRKSLPVLKKLSSLEIVFIDADILVPRPSRMTIDNIFAPNHTFNFLRRLKLRNIECEGQDLMEVLVRHKATLRNLCLEGLFFRSTCWIRFLKDLRHQVYLTEPCICGVIEGYTEEIDSDDHLWVDQKDAHHRWNVNPKQSGGLHEAVNQFILEGGKHHPNPDDCPLTASPKSRRLSLDTQLRHSYFNGGCGPTE